MSEPLRFSVLKQMAKSAAHAYFAMHNPTPDTPGMRLGRLSHAIVLGTPVGPVWEGDRRAGKVWEAFKTEHEGEDIVTIAEFETANCMAVVLMGHGEAAEVLQGTRETKLLFSLAGRACRATPDVFTADHLTEYKTTSDASPQRFPYLATRMNYQAQLSWQRFAIRACGRPVPERVSIVAQESKPPYAVAVYGVTPDALEFGERTWRGWFESFRVCEESDVWPGYPAGVLDSPDEGVELVGTDGEVLELD